MSLTAEESIAVTTWSPPEVESVDSDQGDVLHVEVQIIIGGIGTPLFLTKNKIGVSRTMNDRFRLYRLFDFAKAPKLYILHRDLKSSCSLTPAVYSASPQ